MGLDYDMQLLMSGILNVTQLVGVITTVWTMDSLGRRFLLLWGALFMTICHVIIAILVGLYSDNWPAHRTQGWVSVALLLFYMISFGASWGPVGWAMPSGMFHKYQTVFGVGTNRIYRGVSVLPPCEGCCAFHLLQLAQ
jgi:MFS family permease